MPKAVVLLEQTLDLSERFRVVLKVFKVEVHEKNPDGIKVKFVLLDLVRKVPRLLVDNHFPFGFHIHEELPENRSARRMLKTTDYLSALDEFWRVAKEIADAED